MVFAIDRHFWNGYPQKLVPTKISGNTVLSTTETTEINSMYLNRGKVSVVASVTHKRKPTHQKWAALDALYLDT